MPVEASCIKLRSSEPFLVFQNFTIANTRFLLQEIVSFSFHFKCLKRVTLQQSLICKGPSTSSIRKQCSTAQKGKKVQCGGGAREKMLGGGGLVMPK